MKSTFRCFLILLFGSTLIACGGGGGGDDDSPSLPSDATTITSANASTVARSAVGNLVLFGAITELNKQGDSSLSTGDVIRLVLDRAFDRDRQLASRTTETDNCGTGDDAGTITFDLEETANSASGSLTFTNCDLGGIFIDGSFTFNSDFNDTAGTSSNSGNGSFTITAGSESVTIAMNYDETLVGNSFSTYYSLSITGSSDANFLLTTTSRITGVGDDVTGGEILVEGADGTRLKITVTGTNVADVFLDDGSGTFVFHSTIKF